MKTLSAPQCRPFAQGFTGEYYKLNDSQVLKLYFDFVDPAIVQRERIRARVAHAAGIPTPNSFEVVCCGKRVGILYEMQYARTLSQAILQEPKRTEHYSAIFAHLARVVHQTQCDASILPDFSSDYPVYLEALGFLSDAQKQRLLAQIEQVPQETTCVHGDLHPSNVLLCGHEPHLVGMGDFARGNAWFDIGHIYNIYYAGTQTGACEYVAQLPPSQALHVWYSFVDVYFESPVSKQLREIHEQANLFSLFKRLHVAYLLRGTPAAESVEHSILTEYAPILGDA